MNTLFNPANLNYIIVFSIQEILVNLCKMAVCAFNPSTRNTDAGRSLWIQGLPDLQSKFQASLASATQRDPVSKNKNKKQKQSQFNKKGLCFTF